MQFFFLLLFNVFLGAVLYLIISLKLERSASEFRERRLRKEMDEIIKEFNLTAERNISILESRIRAMRNLLDRSGEIKQLDITLDGEDESAVKEPQTCGPALAADDDGGLLSTDAPRSSENNVVALIKKGLILFFRKIITILPARTVDEATVTGTAGNDGACSAPDAAPVFPTRVGLPERANILIEKELSVSMRAQETPGRTQDPITEEEISEIIRSSEDKYSMVSVLFERGCGIEDISRYSGIPAGEVRLVLNLTRESSGNSL
ncbi:MAG: hypothetical protein JW807_14500 [Spirochaetes bacterium]|nr:hypothetical protein [Spirochaetota bacterium]